MKDSFKTFPKCENCEIFKKTKTHPNRALMCETARATGICPKDLWKQRIEKELREKLKHPIHGYVREDTVISVKEILAET